MSSDVQTMANLDTGDGPSAMQTPLYPIISLFGLLMVVGTFLTWASATNPEDDSVASSVSGLEAGGWGLSALVVGIAIAALGVLGYFWNPFSDPEAMFIAGFAAVAVIGSLLKIADSESLFSDGDELIDFFDPSAGIGLWLVLLGAVLSLLSALWILVSRPKAESRL